MSEFNYAECGLNNVVISGIDLPVDDAGETVYCIPNILGLHKTIAYCVITSDSGIAPEELRFLRTEMGLTQAELAQIVKKDHQTIGRWERGEKTIDANAELVIRMFAAERLGIDVNLTVEEIAKRCIPSTKFRSIEIDGSNPENYRPLAA